MGCGYLGMLYDRSWNQYTLSLESPKEIAVTRLVIFLSSLSLSSFLPLDYFTPSILSSLFLARLLCDTANVSLHSGSQ